MTNEQKNKIVAKHLNAIHAHLLKIFEQYDYSASPTAQEPLLEALTSALNAATKATVIWNASKKNTSNDN